MLRLGRIVLGADDVGRATTSWSEVSGYGATPAQRQLRVHLDLVVDDSAEHSSEADRLVGLGATRVPWDYPPDPDFLVLADTEANRFCIVDASDS